MLLTVCFAAPAMGEPAPLPLSGRIIGIDPGHQRYGNYKRERVSPYSKKTKYKMANGTSGVSTKVPEYVQNLRIGLRLKAALEARGATVFMTRTGHDVNISNRQRALMCNAAGCELVFRLHCNAAGRGSSGIGLYYSPVGPAGTKSRLAAKVALPVLKRSLRPKSVWITRTHSFTGLNWSTVPSLLIEMGFMSNPKEDRKLNNPIYQDMLAAAMADGAAAFLLELDARFPRQPAA